MNEPGFDLILGCNTMKELGIVLDFRTKEITLDEISLPMRDIKNLRTRAAADKAWTVNISIYQSMSKEQSTLKATKGLIEILDAKYEKANQGNCGRGMPQSPQCNRKGQVAEAPARI